MSRKKGKLIVIDGLDGSGKATQTKLLVARLKKAGHKVAVTDFPQYYSSFFGQIVGLYLKGEFGGVNRVSPYLASILYALDRWEAKVKMHKWLDEGRIIVSNRYVSASQIHQTANIRGKRAKAQFLKWLDTMEFKIFGIPRPDLIIYLHVPYRVGQQLVIKKGNRGYMGGVKRDILESSKRHLTAAQKQILDLVRHQTKWQRIDCMQGARLLEPMEISERVWQVVRKKWK